MMALVRAPRATARASAVGTSTPRRRRESCITSAGVGETCLKNFCHGVRMLRPVWLRITYLLLLSLPGSWWLICESAYSPTVGTVRRQTDSPELAWEGLRAGPASPLITVGWVGF